MSAQHTEGPWEVVSAQSSFGQPVTILAKTNLGYVIVATVPSPHNDQLTTIDAVRDANARLIAAVPRMAETLLWIRENLHPRALGRAATVAELLAITHATMVLREAGVIPTPDLTEVQP